MTLQQRRQDREHGAVRRRLRASWLFGPEMRLRGTNVHRQLCLNLPADKGIWNCRVNAHTSPVDAALVRRPRNDTSTALLSDRFATASRTGLTSSVEFRDRSEE
jgi:hypothetical protein